ncbi:pantetheine-phosphate adenylyltransferase [Dissophora ornata]|nr:hypothetical protein BGZ58_009198 [Dissophora ornata]KAI8598176.1 pantetheine-phosphate adenylyltransferase [Dissophora ornata]
MTSDTDHTLAANLSSSHGLLLLNIPDFDAPLGDAFHSIQQALVLVHRLTIVVSTTPPNTDGADSSNTHSNSHEGDLNAKASAGADKKISGTQSQSPSSSSSSSSSSPFHSVQRLLSALYVCFTKLAMALNRPLAELDIVFRESCGYEIGAGTEDEVPFDVLLGMPDANMELEELNRKRLKHGQRTLPIFTLDLTPEVEMDTHLVEAIDSTVAYTKVQEGEYRDVALGGTFDHLHAGHKILLSMTAWITSHRVVCGVTNDEMLKTKKFKEYMEPLDKRIETVEKFLRSFKRGLVYEVVPIHDIYGPTITDDKLQALMVSKETLKGGAAVNAERVNRNLAPLDIEVINVISPTETQVDEVSLKISSTFIRQYLSERDSNS